MITWRIDRAQLQPQFAADVDSICGPDTATWVATYGIRTYAEQDALYAKGRDADGNVIDKAAVVTNAKGGESPHNWGMAIDVTLVKEGKDDWDYATDPDWQRLYAAIAAHPRLHSGIKFPVPDGDHIEVFNWKEHRPPTPEAV